MPSTPESTLSSQLQLLVNIRVKSGTQQQALRAMNRLTEATRREGTGCIRFEVAVDTADDTHYIGYEVWSSQAALDLHSKKAHVINFLAEISACAIDPAHPISATRYTPIMPLTAILYQESI